MFAIIVEQNMTRSEWKSYLKIFLMILNVLIAKDLKMDLKKKVKNNS
jgi:hypothetical protein